MKLVLLIDGQSSVSLSLRIICTSYLRVEHKACCGAIFLEDLNLKIDTVV